MEDIATSHKRRRTRGSATPQPGDRITGTVKFFGVKGWGFITPDANLPPVEGDDGDVFIHYSDITGMSHRTLREGERVVFDLACGRKGYAAKALRLLNDK